jgi:hypothetical protein
MHVVSIFYRNAPRVPRRHRVVPRTWFTADTFEEKVQHRLRSRVEWKQELGNDVDIELVRAQPRGDRRPRAICKALDLQFIKSFIVL